MADQAPHGGDYDSSTDDDSTVTTVASDQPVLTVLMALRVCQFTEAEATSLIAQAFPDWHVFLRMTAKDIVSMAEDYGKRTINDGRIVFGFFRTKELQGLMHWVQDQNRMSKLPSEQQLNPMHLALAAANAEIRKNLADNVDTASKAADPGKLRANTDWYTWSQGFVNYLSTIPGCTGIPLSYVVREFDAPTDPDDDSDYLATLVLRAPLDGPTYMADRRQVHQLLTGKVLGEPAEEWLRDHKRKNNGRVDFKALLNHYEGEGNVSRRISQAEAMHKTLVYKQERAMKFSVFLNKVQLMFQIYKQEGEEKPESAKIRFLLDRVQASHLQQQVTNLRFQHNCGTLTYTSAKNTLMTEVIKMSDSSAESRNVSGLETDTKEKKKQAFKKKNNVKNPPKGDEKIDKKTWYSLTREQQQVIRKYRDDHGLPGGTKTIRAVKSSISDEDVDRIASALHAKQQSSGTTTVSSVSGSAGQAFGGRSDATNRRNNNNTIGQVVSSTRRTIPQMTISKVQQPVHISGRMELDSHADTCVLGVNFVILEYSGRVCDVYPYSQEYSAIKDVPIVRAATAVQDSESGETYILVINEGLWYGDKLDHSLINPNQLRHFGIEVIDNPYAPSGMHIKEQFSGVTVPLQARGTIIFADSFAPTDHELQTCQHIVLTSPALWNPQTVRLGEISSSITDDMDDEHYQRSTAYEIASHSYFIDTDAIYLSHISAAYVDYPTTTTAYISAIDLDVPPIKNFVSKKRHTSVTPEDLSHRWHIGVKQAQRTLDCTTQRYTRSALLPLSRRYRNDRMFYRRVLHHTFAADLYMARSTSLHGMTCAYLFAHKSGFAQVYPQKTKASAEASDSLRQFATDFGIPHTLIVDGALEQVGKNTEFYKRCCSYEIDLRVSTPRRPRENPAEGVIREVRKKWFRLMHATDMPKRLWDYGIRWVTEVMQRTANSSYHSQGRTPLEIVTGDTPDISEYLDFGIYDWVLFKENAGFGDTKLGRFLGISHRVGPMMSYWILPISCVVISCTTVQRLTLLDQQTDVYRDRCEHYNTTIKERLRDANHVIVLGDEEQPYDWDRYDFSHDLDFLDELAQPLVINDPEIPEADLMPQPPPLPTPTPDAFDHYLHMEIALPRGQDQSMEFAKVKRRKTDDDGIPVGIANDNPLLDSRVYVVEWQDGYTEELMANIIAENLFAQVDDEGNRFVLLDDIVDHRKSEDAVSGDDGYIVMDNGMRHRRRTTQGWELCVQWKDQSTTWVALKDMKNAYPLETADYAIANKLQDEPAFAWWVPFTVKKRKRYVSKVKSKYWQRTHKYGIEIPKSVAHAIELDTKNGDTRWWDAIMKEMANVRVAFQKFDGEKRDLPPGFQEIKCHMIFDVKLGENFRRKARYVAGGHVTDPPATTTYSSVVSRESVRIALLIAALNDLEVLSADIQNAYLHAKCREKIWCRAGPEFGSDQGCVMIIVRALYGLKTSGAAFRSLLADRLYDIGYKPTKGDPDVWIRPAVKADGFEYYEMVLVYVDDIFAISHTPRKTLEQIQEAFKFKNDEIAPPDMYLGSKLKNQLINGVECWTMCSDKYVSAAIENVEAKLKSQDKALPKKAITPMVLNYRPEEDVTVELEGDDHTYFQELIGILRWAIELGRIDIMIEVSMLSVHLAMPRKGHLEAALHIFAYLKYSPKRTLAFDPRHPVYDESIFPPPADWHDFYREAKEQVPDDAPPPRGRMVSMHCFVDADHASNKVTRKSQTGILIFLNRAPISWFSKRQNTVETSTFGSEFIAMKTAVEMLQALRHKLRWFGVPIDGPVNVFGDNESVVNSAQKPEVTLSKKHNGIAYHKVREAVAAGTIRVAYVHTTLNLADLLTKPLSRTTRDTLLDHFLY